MQYMLLLYSTPDAGPQDGTPEGDAEMENWFSFTAEVEAAGVYVGGEALLPADTATTVRVRNGESVVTDGPFAETKEHLGGYYILDVADLDAALDWAAKIPNAPYGSVEVRPVMEIPGA